MAACEKADLASFEKLPSGDGKILEGDCQFDSGVSCHFHTSMEFVDRKKPKADSVGEIHCIVPSASTPDRPTVLGAHIRCKNGTNFAKGKACSKDLLAVVQPSRCTTGYRCCDHGTLTKPVSKQHTANVAGLGEEYQGTFSADAPRH